MGLETPRILVLGIGNLLWADEGFGVRCAEVLDAEWIFPSNVTVMDGGTQGLYLLPHLEDLDLLIVFDAVDYGLEPGTMKIVRDDDVPAFMGAKKMSLHQTGFQDVLAAAELTGIKPAHLLLIGVQPEELEDYGGGLRDVVARQIAPAIDVALSDMRVRWGIVTERRAAREHRLSDASISREAYEGGRPSEEEAYRHGDARFLNRARA
ncbi:MAG: HyaD/HybD family hydrogenase maturation endopeptidase [Rubricella sp.]